MLLEPILHSSIVKLDDLQGFRTVFLLQIPLRTIQQQVHRPQVRRQRSDIELPHQHDISLAHHLAHPGGLLLRPVEPVPVPPAEAHLDELGGLRGHAQDAEDARHGERRPHPLHQVRHAHRVRVRELVPDGAVAQEPIGALAQVARDGEEAGADAHDARRGPLLDQHAPPAGVLVEKGGLQAEEAGHSVHEALGPEEPLEGGEALDEEWVWARFRSWPLPCCSGRANGGGGGGGAGPEE